MNEKQLNLYAAVIALVKTDPFPYNETNLADWLIEGDTDGMTPAEIAAEFDAAHPAPEPRPFSPRFPD